jgi:hypothetical protein
MSHIALNVVISYMSIKIKITSTRPYYRKGIETTDYIVSHSMNYLEGNIIKYVTRYKDKGGLEDLKKAEWYLTRLIKQQENNNG